MPGIGDLVKASLQKTSAHGLARPVEEKQRLYIRVLWLIIWLVMCGLFIWYLVKFVKKFQAKDVTTIVNAHSVPFEYPDFCFCYINMMSGSRHQHLSKESVAFINSSFQRSLKWCRETGMNICNDATVDEAAEVQINSLPYKFLADNMAHVKNQSIVKAFKSRSNGLFDSASELVVTEFYHPTYLKCYKVLIAVNKTDKEEPRFAGRNDFLSILMLMDAPESQTEKIISDLPVVKKRDRNLTAPYWAFDKISLRHPRIAMHITQPMHYPSNFDRIVILEAGRTYIVQLEMEEQVHNEDSSRCIDKHPDVQMVNPYDNSPYTVKYNYAVCYNNAVQAQFKREFNATCPFLPHPWPPAGHSLYNLSSGWGSVQDVENYLNRRRHYLENYLDGKRQEEPLEKCKAMRPCTQRSYKPNIESVLWPSPDEVEGLLSETKILDEPFNPDTPALNYLKTLWANRENGSQRLIQYARSNFLFLQLSASKPMADQIIFTRAYNFDSFVADVGGILGICLGMSLLTAFELAQFFHDLAVLLLCSTRERSEHDEISQRDPGGTREEKPNVDTVVVGAKQSVQLNTTDY